MFNVSKRQDNMECEVLGIRVLVGTIYYIVTKVFSFKKKKCYESYNNDDKKSKKKNKKTQYTNFTWFDSVPISTGTAAQNFTITEIGLHKRIFIIIPDMIKL